MKIELTALIISQAKTFMVMMAAGILTESLWQIKNRLQLRFASVWQRILEEGLFWIASVAIVPAFLYYCAYGKISLHAIAGFLLGLLLWKKLCYGIIPLWERNDEARNSKTTAKSSIWMKRDGSGSKRDRRRRKRNRKSFATPQARGPEEKWLSDEAVTGDDC